MGNGHPAGETGVDPLHGLRGEGDFRHQENGLAALLNDPGNGLQIDLGFTAAGNPVEQEGAGLHRGIFQGFHDTRQGVGLGRGQGRRRFGSWGDCRFGAVRFCPERFRSGRFRICRGRGCHYPAFLAHPFQSQQALVHQGITHAAAKLPIGLGGGIARAAFPHRVEQPLLAVGYVYV